MEQIVIRVDQKMSNPLDKIQQEIGKFLTDKIVGKGVETIITVTVDTVKAVIT